jgi:predicted lipid-binding transport protein (Tim44 family)
MEFLDLGTLVFMVAAVVIFIQLRNVLGRRTGNERPPFDPYTAGRKAEGANEAAKPFGQRRVAATPQNAGAEAGEKPMRRSTLSPNRAPT